MMRLKSLMSNRRMGTRTCRPCTSLSAVLATPKNLLNWNGKKKQLNALSPQFSKYLQKCITYLETNLSNFALQSFPWSTEAKYLLYFISYFLPFALVQSSLRVPVSSSAARGRRRAQDHWAVHLVDSLQTDRAAAAQCRRADGSHGAAVRANEATVPG